MQLLNRASFLTAAGEIFQINCSLNPVGQGYFASVSMVGKEWRRVSGPWPTKELAMEAATFGLSLIDAAMGKVQESVSADVVELRKLKANGAHFVVTESCGKWAIIWSHVKSDKFVDTELRYAPALHGQVAMTE